MISLTDNGVMPGGLQNHFMGDPLCLGHGCVADGAYKTNSVKLVQKTKLVLVPSGPSPVPLQGPSPGLLPGPSPTPPLPDPFPDPV